LTERGTTLTDFALAALCAGFAFALSASDGLALLYSGLFAALGAASLAGGLWHGWWQGQPQGTGGWLWRAVMLAVGAANLALWLIAAQLSGWTLFAWIGWAASAGYLLAILAGVRSFLLSSGFSLPPTLALLVVFALDLTQPGFGLGALGLSLALIGAGLQAAKIGLPGLGYNALYHLIQGGAFTLLFVGLPGA